MTTLLASSLLMFLEGRLSANQLLIELAPLSRRRSIVSPEAGESIPIDFTEDVDYFVVKPEHIFRICDAYTNDELREEDVVYCMVAIELSECFVPESEAVDEAISLLSDPVSNGPLTKDVVAETVASLFPE